MSTQAGIRPTRQKVNNEAGLCLGHGSTSWRRFLYLLCAGVSFALAAAGVVLPGLPTTPFLLLTSFCLVRCSPTLHRQLLSSPVFGRILHDWHTHRGVRPGIKTKSIAFVVIVVGASLAWGTLPPLGILAVASLATIGIAVIARLPVVSI